MKKLLAILICVLMIFSVVPVSVSAVGETLEATFATPTVDGIIDDVWRTTSRQKLKYAFQANGKITNKASSTVYVSSLWDGKAIYFLIEIIDDDFTFGGEGKYDNDSLNIYIDEADLFGETWQEGQNCISVVPNEGAGAKVLHGEISPKTQIAYSEAGDTIRNIEIKYVPTQLKLWRGLKLLVDFKYIDVNEEGKLENTLAWSDQLGEGDKDSSNWSYLKLIDKASSSSGYQTAELAALSIGQPLIEKYTFVDGTDGYNNEGPDRIWDGDTGTKFCTGDFPQRSYAKLDGEYYISGVIMATANDNANYSGRCPDDWKIQGSVDGKNWVTLAEGDEKALGDENYTFYAKLVKPSEIAFKYVRFVNNSAESGLCQLSEVMVCGIKNTASTEEIDVFFGRTENNSDGNKSGLLKIVGAHDNIYSDDIIDPNAPLNNAGNLASTSTALVTIIASTIFLLALCGVIVMLQSRKERKH